MAASAPSKSERPDASETKKSAPNRNEQPPLSGKSDGSARGIVEQLAGLVDQLVEKPFLAESFPSLEELSELCWSMELGRQERIQLIQKFARRLETVGWPRYDGSGHQAVAVCADCGIE